MRIVEKKWGCGHLIAVGLASVLVLTGCAVGTTTTADPNQSPESGDVTAALEAAVAAANTDDPAAAHR